MNVTSFRPRQAKGFNVDYLAKVPEVKDTVHKHSLLHHLCHMVMEKYPESSDLYSEVSHPGQTGALYKLEASQLAWNYVLKVVDSFWHS